MNVQENPNIKIFNSDEYNYIFNKNNGFFVRWGKDKQDDPDMSPYGPEILDVEISTICNGIGDYGPCNMCYKSNTSNGTYMSLETFKQVFNNLPSTVCQIALGVDAKCESNPDTFLIMKHCLNNGIIPNVTVADVDDERAYLLSRYCGSVAVSRYHDKDICYNTIQKLVDYGQNQINIHIMISQETLNQVYETFEDYYYSQDPRLKELNAIVLLSLKQKGRGKGFTPLTQQQFDDMVNYAFSHNIPIGFDSCSAPKLFNTIKDFPNREELEQVCEPCESSAFSFYVNVNGEGFPCSFVEGEDEWSEGIDLTVPLDFLKDVWYTDKVVNWRQKLLDNNRNCPVFNV